MSVLVSMKLQWGKVIYTEDVHMVGSNMVQLGHAE